MSLSFGALLFVLLGFLLEPLSMARGVRSDPRRGLQPRPRVLGLRPPLCTVQLHFSVRYFMSQSAYRLPGFFYTVDYSPFSKEQTTSNF